MIVSAFLAGLLLGAMIVAVVYELPNTTEKP